MNLLLLSMLVFLSTFTGTAQGRGGRSGNSSSHDNTTREIGNTRIPSLPNPRQPGSEMKKEIRPHPVQAPQYPPPITVYVARPLRLDPVDPCFTVRDIRPDGLCITEGVVYGQNITLSDFNEMPEYSGFDFSESAKLPFDDPFVDAYLEWDNGAAFMRVRDDSDIMDIGELGVPKDVIFVLRQDWSEHHEALLILAHEYVIQTWDHHYAKFRVTGMPDRRVVIDWAYQQGDVASEDYGASRETSQR